jgi:hypothetical protein
MGKFKILSLIVTFVSPIVTWVTAACYKIAKFFEVFSKAKPRLFVWVSIVFTLVSTSLTRSVTIYVTTSWETVGIYPALITLPSVKVTIRLFCESNSMLAIEASFAPYESTIC